MYGNIAHVITKLMNNTPIDISANDSSTTVVTKGGGLFQAGFIDGNVQAEFKEVIANKDIQGTIVKAVNTEKVVYFLNADGVVFAYDYKAESCNPLVREVYTPSMCEGDPAVDISGGRAHLLILTKKGRAFGVGCNNEYQLVPYGQCRYEVATELLVDKTLIHDNTCCDTFSGYYTESDCQPEECSPCGNVSCLTGALTCQQVGTLEIPNVTLTPTTGGTASTGNLNINLCGNVNYVGFLCINSDDYANGSVTFSLSSLFIPGCNTCSGCPTNGNLAATATTCTTPVTFSTSSQLDLFTSSTTTPPITTQTLVSQQCGSQVTTTIPSTSISLPSVTVNASPNGLILTLGTSSTLITITGYTISLTAGTVTLTVDPTITLTCCSKAPCEPKPLNQPCWSGVYAGFDISVLVDSCNRLYALGSLHEVRSNKDLLKKPCLESLLSKTKASISLPADQLQLSNGARDQSCACPKCKDSLKTDLSKFGINLDFCPENNGCCGNNMNVADFLKQLVKCQEQPSCDSTCEPCDRNIYLDLTGKCSCDCDNIPLCQISSFTFYNRKSLQKLIRGCSNTSSANVNVCSILEFNMNMYCLDGTTVCIDNVLILSTGSTGVNVNIFIDIDKAGAVVFCVPDSLCCNVSFTVNANSSCQQFLLNYGSVLDPVELSNLKYALNGNSTNNFFGLQLINTYLRGGDRVKFEITQTGQPIKQAVTADIPTVFRMTRKVLDVGVGFQNLSVLVGGLSCPNEIYGIGRNCNGELGLDSNESYVCFKQVDRCVFSCQVVSIFSGYHVTFYVTQDSKLYASGVWKCLLNSTVPAYLPIVPRDWKIQSVAVSQTHLVFLGPDGELYGTGDNHVGELGLCHTDCVTKVIPLPFFQKLNQYQARQLQSELKHPYERKFERRETVREYRPNSRICCGRY